jgi:hypothetical protein
LPNGGMVTSGISLCLVVAFFASRLADDEWRWLLLHQSRVPAWLGRKIWWRHLEWVSPGAVALVARETQPYPNGISEIVTD